MHPKVVQELLGHSSITLTLDTYSHVVRALHAEVARRMQSILGLPDGSKLAASSFSVVDEDQREDPPRQAKTDAPELKTVAERVGFEPTIELPL